MKTKYRILLAASAVLAAAICAIEVPDCIKRPAPAWTESEKEIIGRAQGGVMRVLKTDISEDSTILKSTSLPVRHSDFDSHVLDCLIKGMLATVQDTANPGVGIAAPQVGILRRVIIVQRFDKPDKPFEAYLNPEITYASDSMRIGGEGCLSVPYTYGKVRRPAKIGAMYIKYGESSSTYDTMSGFTAAIFQHEYDHLNGNLFTERADTTFKTDRR